MGWQRGPEICPVFYQGTLDPALKMETLGDAVAKRSWDACNGSSSAVICICLDRAVSYARCKFLSEEQVATRRGTFFINSTARSDLF
jgi:hypothetical protein